MLRRPLLAISRSARLKELVTTMPVSKDVVARFVAGEGTEDAVGAARVLRSVGLATTLDHLGEDTVDEADAEATVQAYLALLEALVAAGVTDAAEVSVKLSAVGQSLGADGDRIALDNARRIAQAASNAGTTMTLDAEDHTTTDSTLAILEQVRQDFPDTGAVLQAYLHRTESDCRALSQAGSRVRLCKGAYREPETVAFTDPHAVDRSYVRCARALMEGRGYPMIATHDPRMIRIAGELARRNGRGARSFEYQMLFGIRPEEQRRLTDEGHRVRVYVPYGSEWYGYLVRRLAERPANVAFFARSLVSRS